MHQGIRRSTAPVFVKTLRTRLASVHAERHEEGFHRLSDLNPTAWNREKADTWRSGAEVKRKRTIDSQLADPNPRGRIQVVRRDPQIDRVGVGRAHASHFVQGVEA